MSTNPNDAANVDSSAASSTPQTESRPITTELETPAGTVSISIDAHVPPPATATSRVDQPAAAISGSSATSATAGSTRTGAAVRGGNLQDGTDGSFFGQLQGIPIEYLIATPLLASARSNMALAQVMTEFIDEIGFESDGKTTRIVSFQLTREVQDPDTKKFAPQTITVQAPLLALVPLPALLIQSVTIDLTVEISQAVTQNSSSTTNAELKIGSSWGWGSASFTGSYTNTQSSTRATNQTAKYEVTVNAQQQPLPEGMSRLMDVFASTITPIPATAS